MEYVNFDGCLLDISEKKSNVVVNYLLDSNDDLLLYDEYEKDTRTLYITGGCSCIDKEDFINNFLDFLYNNNTSYLGTWE